MLDRSDAAFRKVTSMRPAEELAAEALRRGERLRIKARGGSMLPFFRDGDVALVTPTAESGIGVGDIVCYERPPGRLFLHRVIACESDRFVAKGDALTFTDVIDRRHLLGKVVALERRGRLERLDSRAARWRNRTIVSLSHVIPRLVPLAIGLRRIVRAVLRG